MILERQVLKVLKVLLDLMVTSVLKVHRVLRVPPVLRVLKFLPVLPVLLVLKVLRELKLSPASQNYDVLSYKGDHQLASRSPSSLKEMLLGMCTKCSLATKRNGNLCQRVDALCPRRWDEELAIVTVAMGISGHISSRPLYHAILIVLVLEIPLTLHSLARKIPSKES